MDNNNEMIKSGVVQPGKTPSAVSGKPSETVKNGEAVRKDETAKDLKNLSELIDI